jgi:trehalose 6-phosphate phosphatase
MAYGMTIDDIVAALRERPDRALVALDFDGTLAPIVADPADARPVGGTHAALRGLAARGTAVAVITGRDARTVVRLAGLDQVPGIRVAGLYGIETWHDGTLDTVAEPPELARLRARLPEVVAGAATDPRVWIEDKRLSLVVHARRCDDPAAQIALVRASVAQLAGELGLQVHDGRDVLEVRIPGYDKGTALRRLVDDLQPDSVLFAGDDLGDLPAIEETRRLRATGTAAYSVAVRSAEAAAVAAAADASVADPAGLITLLTRLAEGADRS